MEKAGWLGWPFSVASRGDCAIGIRKDQPGYTIDNCTINILCLSIVYPDVRVYSKSIHIHTSFTIFTYIYIYIMFVHLGFKYKWSLYTYCYSNTCKGGVWPAHDPEVGWANNYFVFLLGRGKSRGFHLQIEVEGFVRFVDLKLLNAITIWVVKMWKDGSMSQYCTSCLWIAHILPTLYTPSCFNPAEYVYRSKQVQSYTYISS